MKIDKNLLQQLVKEEFNRAIQEEEVEEGIVKDMGRGIAGAASKVGADVARYAGDVKYAGKRKIVAGAIKDELAAVQAATAKLNQVIAQAEGNLAKHQAEADNMGLGDELRKALEQIKKV